MGVANWAFVLTDKNFVPQGEFLDVKNMELTIPLNKARTMKFRIRLDNKLAPFIAVKCSQEPLYVKAYRNGTLLSFGQMMTVQEAGDEKQNATLEINTSGPEYVFAKRLWGFGNEGIKYGAGLERAAMFKDLLRRSEELTFGATHIDLVTGPIKSTNTGEYQSPPFKKLSEILNELYNQVGGFDWIVHPQEVIGTNIGRLEIADKIYTERPNAVFEWGTGFPEVYGGRTKSNVGTFTRIIDMSNIMNVGYNITSAGPEATGAPTVTKTNVPSQEAWGRQEDVVSLGALNQGMREAFTEESVNVRSKPRQTIAFTPVVDDGSGRVPVLGKDFEVGDGVRARIIYEGQAHLDAIVRIWSAGFQINETGLEKQTLTFSEA